MTTPRIQELSWVLPASSIQISCRSRMGEKVKLIPTVRKNNSDKIKNNRREGSGASVLYGYGLASAHGYHQPTGAIMFMQTFPFPCFSVYFVAREVLRGPSSPSPGLDPHCLSGELGSHRSRWLLPGSAARRCKIPPCQEGRWLRQPHPPPCQAAPTN